MAKTASNPHREIAGHLPRGQAAEMAGDPRLALLLDQPRGGRPILYGIAFFLALFLVWAGLTEVESVTRGVGKVIPASQVQRIQNLEGGILREILVREGEEVEAGQLLLRLDRTRFSAAYQENRRQRLALAAKAARLRAETTGGEFEPPVEVAREHPELARRERTLYLTRKRQLEATLGLLTQRVEEQAHELARLETELADLEESHRLAKKELELSRPLLASGAVSEVELLRLQRQVNELKTKIDNARLAIPKTRARLEAARKKVEEEALAFRNRAKEEANEVQAELERLEAGALALEDRLRRTEVRSPVHGTVNRVLVTTIGGVVRPGMDLVEIVPLEDSLVIEARISPRDIAFLHPRQPVTVKFTAYDFTVYGGLEAELEHISADTITDAQGRSFYLVRVRTLRNHLGSDDDPLPILPGMVATVDIRTGKKSILAALLKPILRAKQTALREP